MFHLVGAGQCRVIGDDGTNVHLGVGDAVLFMRPTDHRVVSIPRASVQEDTLLLCGYFEFESPLARTLLDSLPSCVILRQGTGVADATAGSAASLLLQLVVNETASPQAGSDALLDKLADALFIFATRQCLNEGRLRTGFLLALGDTRMRAALEAMHASPGRAWTVEALARRASLSRAAFARRFRSTMGVSPKHYLTALRLQAGRSALEEQGATLARAAEQAGYASEASFSRAFKHQFGVSPGTARRSRQGSNQAKSLRRLRHIV